MTPWGLKYAQSPYSKISVVSEYQSYEMGVLVEEFLVSLTISVEGGDRVATQMTQYIYDEYAVKPVVFADKLWGKNPETVGDWVLQQGESHIINLQYMRQPKPFGCCRLSEPQGNAGEWLCLSLCRIVNWISHCNSPSLGGRELGGGGELAESCLFHQSRGI